MASNPEFLKEGAAIADFNKPDRVVVGCEDPAVGERMRELYQPFVRQGNPIYVMDIASAEMVKYAANAMLATKISFINEIANLCEAYGADVDRVRQGMVADTRIGKHFLYAGVGYGGSCFPKDVLAVVGMGQQTGTPVRLAQAVHETNQLQRMRFVTKIDRHFGSGEPDQPADLSAKRIAVWGLAFKPGTDDVRESPAITLISELRQRGAEVSAYDPVAVETARPLLPAQGVSYAPDRMAALDGAHALIVCTNWDEFMHPNFDTVKSLMAQPVIFDGRNIYRPEALRQRGFTYYSVGRPACR
jgi:UDPglucose 6-dehydrogenase